MDGTITTLLAKAEAKRNELKDDTDPEIARKIEAEHDAILSEIETLKHTAALVTRSGLSTARYEGLSDRETRAAVLRDLADRDGEIRMFPHTDVNAPARAQENGIADAFYARLSSTAPSEHARPYMHRSMVNLMRSSLESQGVRAFGFSDSDVIRTAMQTRSSPGMHSTSDFPILLANTMGRRLGELFRAAESGASAIVAAGTARDFRPITEARLTSFPSLEPLGQGAEILWGTMDEEGEVLAIGSFARGITITFNALVNDDLAAIDRSIRDIAFAAAQLKAKLIITALSATLRDGKSLFHSTHSNLAASGAAPDEATLSAGRVAMAKQTPPGSTEPLGLKPSLLVVPAELETSAEKLVSTIQAAKTSDANVFAGKLSVAVEPRLPNATQWFLFSAPGTYPVIRFLTLDGFEAPQLETQSEFDRLGESYRVHWHCGAGPVDFRGTWKNPGA